MNGLAARRKVGAMFLADWVDVVFVHFEVDAQVLAREVPIELDLWEGKAYVSLVGFTQKRLRPRWGGRMARWLTAPVGNHEFLNVRTYVRVRGEPGIYFMVEWVPNRLAKLVGPRLYGLPYRLGRLRYEVDEECECVTGEVCAEGRLRFAARVRSEMADEAREGTLDAFLLERYTAFTCRDQVLRRFRIWHEPWEWVRARCEFDEQSLLDGQSWMESARMQSAHYSTGVSDVLIGRPQRLAG